MGRIEQLKRDGHHHDDFLQHRWADDGGHIYHPDDFLQSRTNPSPGALIVIGVEMDLNVAGEGTADQLAAFDLATMRHAAQATR